MKILIDPKDPQWTEKTAFGNISNEFADLLLAICLIITAIATAGNLLLTLLK